jgi:hypothetical protein
MYKYKYKYKYGFMDPRTSQNVDLSLYEKNYFISQPYNSYFYKKIDGKGESLALPPPDPNKAYFYKGLNAEGESLVISFGDYPDLGKITNWNKAIRSVRFGERVIVELYRNINYRGGSVRLTEPARIYNLPDIRLCLPGADKCLTWDKQTSSLKVLLR